MVFRRLTVLFALVLLALPAHADTRVPESRAEMSLSFSPVVRRAAPAVVNIYATRIVAERVGRFANDPFFRDLFGGGGRTVPRLQNSLGSGVIVSPDGIVVSNHHVVGDAAEIRVVLADRREFEGRIVLSDPEADLAVIQLDGASDLPALDFADSDMAEVGDLVLAIGNPFGVGQTVTSGIVSGLARSAGGEGRRGSLIQTDAPINPGNSGGALVDMSGRLLGINTSILTRSGGSNGIGFAIPAGVVRQYVAQAREGRTRFLAPWSGLVAQTVDADLATALGLDRPEGVMITQLHPQSPFAAAGLAVGDLIRSVGGAPVASAAELDARLVSLGLGTQTEVAFLRAGEPRTAPLAIAPAPDTGGPPVRVTAPGLFEGLAAAALSPRLIQDLGLPLDARGVAVVETPGRAARSGLRPGDLVEAVNGRAIASPEALRDALSAPGPVWDILLLRDGRAMRLRFHA